MEKVKGGTVESGETRGGAFQGGGQQSGGGGAISNIRLPGRRMNELIGWNPAANHQQDDLF